MTQYTTNDKIRVVMDVIYTLADTMDRAGSNAFMQEIISGLQVTLEVNEDVEDYLECSPH
jgi:hypothetical protein